MSRLRDYFLKTILIILFAFLIAPSSPVRAGQSTEIRGLIELWLLDNCDLGEEGVSEKRLMGLGTAAEPYLILALEKGPEKKLIEDLEGSLTSRWKKRAEILRSADGTVLGKESLESARKVTREEYITSERSSFILRFRDRANRGLGLTGSDKSLNALKRVASDETSPLRRSAQEALQRIGRRLAK